MLDQADYVVELARQRFRAGNQTECAVKNVMTAIAPERLAIGRFSENRVCRQLFDSLRSGLPTERNHFHGNRPAHAKAVDHFGFVHDDQQPLAGVGQNLLPQERAAKAFDQVEISRVDFIRAVDGDIDLRVFVERSKRDFQRARLRRRSLRGWNSDDP